MERRGFVGLLAASVGAALSACSAEPTSSTSSGSTATPAATPSPTPTPTPTPTATPRLFSAPTGITKIPVPRGTIYALPGEGNLMALTVDDGTDTRVVNAYADLAERTGIRLTFFANGNMPSWTEHADRLRPLNDDGQILICNHTWSHPDLTKLSAADLTDQVTRNETFLNNTYGTPGRPFMRPPFGFRNSRTDAQLADLGYPVITMWEGSLSDSGSLPPEVIYQNAEKWFLPQHLVIGHANHPPVIDVMDRLAQLIHDRGMTPVHLGDIYALT